MKYHVICVFKPVEHQTAWFPSGFPFKPAQADPRFEESNFPPTKGTSMGPKDNHQKGSDIMLTQDLSRTRLISIGMFPPKVL